MRLSRILVASCAVLLGVAAVGAGNAEGPPSHRSILTFSGPVALPGVSLCAGSYTFEIADPDAGSDAVVVLNRDRTQVLYMGLTKRIRRPSSLPSGHPVTLGEPSPGGPARIIAWYPSGESWGHQFIYTAR